MVLSGFPIEAFEDAVLCLGGDAGALIGDFEADVVGPQLDGVEGDGGGGRGELDGVGEEIGDDLGDAGFIGGDEGEVAVGEDLQGDLLVVGGLLETEGEVVEEGGGCEGLEVEVF